MTRHVTTMTIDDAPHISAAQRQEIINSYPEHEKEARTKGIPSLGSGRVFPITEESIVCDPFEIPKHWAQLNGLDFGWDHPFAAANCAWDRDADVFYVCKTYRESKATPPIHAAAIRPWGAWIPCAWPADGLQTGKGDGKALSSLYEDQQLEMLAEFATHETGGVSVEAAVMDMLERMQTGRWKVFRGLNEWLEEFRLYHRKNGQIVKLRDDLLSASRYALMMKRFAITKPVARVANMGGSPHRWMG